MEVDLGSLFNTINEHSKGSTRNLIFCIKFYYYNDGSTATTESK